MKHSISIILIILVFAGCTKKYPEGGSRVNDIFGSYYLVGFTVDAVDSMDVIKASPFYCLDQNAFEFSKQKKENILRSGCSVFPHATWYISDDKKRIIITCSPTSNTHSLYPLVQNKNVSMAWDIQRITRDDFWIKAKINGKEYYFKFEYIH